MSEVFGRQTLVSNDSDQSGSHFYVLVFPFIFKRVVARRAVYHTLNVITISLYVCPSVCVKRVLRGGGLDPLLKKMVSEHH